MNIEKCVLPAQILAENVLIQYTFHICAYAYHTFAIILLLFFINCLLLPGSIGIL